MLVTHPQRCLETYKGHIDEEKESNRNGHSNERVFGETSSGLTNFTQHLFDDQQLFIEFTNPKGKRT